MTIPVRALLDVPRTPDKVDQVLRIAGCWRSRGTSGGRRLSLTGARDAVHSRGEQQKSSQQKSRPTRRGAFSGPTLQGWMVNMADELAQTAARAGAAGRSRRRGVALVEMKTRVRPDAHAVAHRAAAALGVTMAEYVEALLLHEELGSDGRPVWWTRPVPTDQEELPLKSA